MPGYRRKQADTAMKLSERIEALRQIMHELGILHGIRHPKVLEVSQQLDVLINEYYKK